MSASLIAPIATAAAPAAPKIGFPTVNPTIAPTTPRQIATIRRAFCAELLPAPRVSSWYPHDGQLTAVSEIDLLHSGHAIKPTPVLLSLPNAKDHPAAASQFSYQTTLHRFPACIIFAVPFSEDTSPSI
jgi:hypothetical protein